MLRPYSFPSLSVDKLLPSLCLVLLACSSAAEQRVDEHEREEALRQVPA